MEYKVITYLVLAVALGSTCVFGNLDNCSNVKTEFAKISDEDFVPDAPIAGKVTGTNLGQN